MKTFCIACVAGILTGVLLADGTFINYRGDEIRQIIEQMDEPEPAV